MSTWVYVKTRCSSYECDTNEMVSICSPPENHHHSSTRVICTFTGPIYFLKWPKVYFFRAEDNLLTEVPYDFSLLLQKLVKPLSHMYASSRKVHTSTDVIVLYVGALYYSSIRNRNIIYKYFLTELDICMIFACQGMTRTWSLWDTILGRACATLKSPTWLVWQFHLFVKTISPLLAKIYFLSPYNLS